MSSDSSCPDLTHYTWNVLHSVSAEACKNKNRLGNYNETLALVTGTWCGNELNAKSLLFPKQNGSSTETANHGKDFHL